MLIGIAMQEVEQFVEGLITSHCHLLGDLGFGDAIDRKDVDIDTPHIVAVFTLNQCGTAIDNLSKAPGIVGIGLNTQGLQGLWQPLTGMHHETVVVGTGHTDVHVIVPGDKPLVPDSAQHSTSPTVVSDVMRLTDTVYRQEYL